MPKSRYSKLWSTPNRYSQTRYKRLQNVRAALVTAQLETSSVLAPASHRAPYKQLEPPAALPDSTQIASPGDISAGRAAPENGLDKLRGLKPDRRRGPRPP